MIVADKAVPDEKADNGGGLARLRYEFRVVGTYPHLAQRGQAGDPSHRSVSSMGCEVWRAGTFGSVAEVKHVVYLLYNYYPVCSIYDAFLIYF